jgi:type IV pilus assembly protein PilE
VVELVASLAIVSILALLAVPSYQAGIQKSRRTDAISALQNLHLAQERFRANCATYATSMGGSDLCDTGTSTFRVNVSAASPEGYYAIAILNGANGTGFVATADPSGSAQAADACGTFAVDQDGPITDNASYAGERCWAR